MCPEETNTTSGITLTWPSTPIGEISTLSCPNTDGNATRNCTVGGIWEQPYVQECTCPEETNTTSGITLTWPSTPIGEISTLSCPNTDGNATRMCTVGGVWEEPYVQECTCPEETNTTSGITLTWPSTPIGEISTLSCPNTDGNATRMCTVGGVWEQPYVQECTCPEETNTTSGITLTWPSTPIGEISTLSCPNTDGNATRMCTVGGVWEQPYVQECTCPEETNTTSGITLTWPSTPIGEISTLSCPNTDGNATRMCTEGGVWEQPYGQECTCPEETNTTSGITLTWPSTPIGEISTLSCPNTDGNATRICTEGGVWEQPYVQECTCPEETNTTSGITLTWPSTPIGEISTLSCPNTDGNATRMCTVGGVWEQPYVQECTCPEETNTTSGITLTWPSTPIGEISTLSCPNTDGNATRMCTVGGVWEQPYVQECTCPEETNTTSGITLTWPSTPIGEISTLSCPNADGNATRMCTVGGVWEQPYVQECTCPEETNTTSGITLTWPSTPIGEISTLSCPNTDRNTTRVCTVGGVWEQPYVHECTCPEETNTTSGITLTWPSTPIGEISTLSCPNADGNATRICTVGGVWEQPYVQECTCPEETNTTSGITLTWPSTPIGEISTLSCPNTDGNTTRMCTVGGVWEQPYVQECTCPEETNTTSGITLTWPSTPIGEISTLSCPNTDGNATRMCTVGGVWEQPYVYECTCPEETNTTSGITLTWPSTPIGEISTLSCPNADGNATRMCTVGGVWEQPYVHECTCPEETNTTSGITLTWPSTPIGEISTLSCPNADGNATRMCTVGGVWEQPYVHECTCPEETNTTSGITLTWPSTPIGEISTLSCPNADGNATRMCTVGGVWEQPYVHECTCPEETNTTSGITLTWPSTPIGEISTLSCPNADGNATRMCTVGGVWEQPYVQECTCPEETNTTSGITLTWPSTPIGEISTLSCPNADGNATRVCTEGGVWEQPYVHECTCPEETNTTSGITLTWPSTPIGEISTLSCPNADGNATRMCTVGGVWEQPYVHECTCPEETNTTSGITLTWPSTPIGEISTLSCPNADGNATRMCTVGGVWEQPYVHECTCPEETNTTSGITLTWPSTPIGEISTLSCPNADGNATRMCTEGGVWEQPYVQECTCPEETNTTSGITLTWPSTPIGEISTLSCPNADGNATRMCTVGGVWEQPYVHECTCPEETNTTLGITLTWPSTPIGEISTLSCPNANGNATRMCTVGGVWEQPYVQECTCPEETNTTSGITLTWPSTPIGEISTLSCPNADGNATRMCTVGGVWEQPYVHECTCPEETNTTSGITLTWPSTPIGEISTLSCPNADGNATRMCTVGGVWEQPYVHECTCPEETNTTSGITLTWPSTPIGEISTLSCPNADGNATRMCTEGGVWEQPYVQECTCPEETNTTSGITLTWPSTPIGEISTLSCPNADGNATRMCTVGGIWEQPYVHECTCPEETNTTSGITLTWPSTPIGEISTLSCPNANGNATRMCTVGGVWEQPYVHECTCPEETNTTSGITLTWPSTPIEEISTLSCPNADGNATRMCTVGGVWEQPYVQECTCPEETNTTLGITLTWPSTPIGEISTLSCPNADGNATRMCTEGGVWEQPYVQECTCPEETNTTSGITLTWPSTPIGEISTLSCPNADGNATRICTVGGVWEQPYVQECTCPEETNTTSGITLTWPSTPIGEISTLSCPNADGNATRMCTVGGVWEQPYVHECTCPEETNTTSGITLTWPSTPIGEISTLSCPNADGNATRMCTVGGVWEQPYVQECTCPEETNTTSGITLTWPSTPIGEISTLSCPNADGNATRVCTEGGVWEQPYVHECTCPEETNTTSGITLTWPSTPIGEISTLSCPNADGNATRMCTVGGVWEQPYVHECTCPEETNTTSGITLTWPSTPIGEISTLSCPNADGNATRMCTVGGVWEQPYVHECTCPEETNTTSGITLTWPSTPIGEISTLSCPNADGNATRMCTVGGVWEQPYVHECTCPEETNTTSGITLTWPSTPIGEISTLSCPNADGNATRMCTEGGVWEQPYVQECTCPEETNTTSGITLTWPSTPIGEISTLSCPNADGNATRMCTVGGVWEQPYVHECTCPEETNTTSGITLTWPSTPIGEISTLSCPNADGNATRMCTVGGVWEQPYVQECTCPEETNTTSGITLTWPSTPIEEISTLSCPNADGNATRMCTVGGVWEQPYVQECTCPEETNTTLGITLTWPSTPIGEISTLSCPNADGNATRMCTEGGVWEQPYVQECTCPEETNTTSGITLTWPSTPIGEISTLSCPNADGNATRICTVGGVWEQPYVQECTCPEETNTTSGITLTWPSTPIGEISTLSCPNADGNATRMCTVGGVWEQPYVQECTCPEETNTTSGITLTWPSTPIGEISTLSCPNADGNATRMCTVGGVWEQPYVQECTCPEETNTTSGITLTWPSTPIGEISTLSCPNTDGNATRMCTVGGVWEQPYVHECTCPEETNTTSGITLTWPSTPIGEISTLSCPNADGNATRMCTVGGVWEQPYVHECTCPEETNTTSGITLTWPSTPIGEISTLSCPNTDGNATRNCSVGGVWEQPYVQECIRSEETNTISELTSSQSVVAEETPSLSDVPEMASSPSVLAEVTPSLSDVPEMTSSSSVLVEVTSSLSDVPEMMTSSPSMLAEVTPSLSDVPEMMTSSPSVLVEVTSSLSDVPEMMTSSPSVLAEVTPSLSDVPEMKSSSSALVEVTSSLSDVPEMMTSFPSVLAEVTPSLSDVPEMKSSSSVLVEVTSSLSDVPEMTSSSVLVEVTSSLSDVPEMTSFPSVLAEVTPSLSDVLVMTSSSSVLVEVTSSLSDIPEMMTSSPSMLAEVTPSLSDVPEMTSSSSVLVEMTSSLSDVPEMKSFSSVLVEVTSSLSDVPEMTSSSVLVEVTSSLSDVPEMTSSPSVLAEVTPSLSDVPVITSSSVLVEVTSSLSDVPEMTSSPSVLAEVTPSLSDVPVISSSSSVLVEVTSSLSDVPEMTSSPSVLAEVTPSLSDVPVITSSSSVLVEVTSSLSDVPEMTSSPSVLAEVTPSLSDVPVITSSSSVLVEVTSSLSDVPEMTSSPSVLAEVTPSLSDVPEMTSSSSVLVEVTSSLSDVPKMMSSPSVLAEVTPSLSDVPVMTSSPSVLAEVTSSLSDVPEMTPSPSVLVESSEILQVTSSPSVTTLETLSISEISQIISSQSLLVSLFMPFQNSSNL